MDLPPLPLLDPAIAAAVAHLAQGERELAEGGGRPAPSPLAQHREVSSRWAYVELGEQPGVLNDAAQAWVGTLTLERVLWPDRVRLALAWRAESIEVEGQQRVRVTPRAALARVLREPEAELRRFWAEVLERGAGEVADAALILAERRAEATRRLGAEADRLELPWAPPAAVAGVAARLLRDSAALARPGAERWDEAIAGALGREARAGWPARLGSRWLEGLFHASGLTDGLRPALGGLPAALGAASFARALAAFGAALAEADGPPSAPFVVAHRPFDLRPARRAALFGSLVADPIFNLRALGLGRDAAREQARVAARALLVSLRLEAAKVLLRGVMLLAPRERGARFEETTASALGAPVPASLLGALPALSPRAPTSFCGALLAAVDRRTLIEHFDEDWFRSPHAAEAIRDEDAAAVSPPALGADQLEAATGEALRSLTEVLA